MSQNNKQSQRPSGASLIALIVALSVAVIYFANTGGVAYLLPDLVATGVATPMAGTVAGETLQPSQLAAAETTRQDAAPADVAAPTPTIPASIAGIPTIRYADLPPEAHNTMALIVQGGPFPYDKDGSVFQNREGLLPSRPRGYYREYTVITPGESDRGARRIVTGGEGEFYYTDDHYASFQRVVQ